MICDDTVFPITLHKKEKEAAEGSTDRYAFFRKLLKMGVPKHIVKKKVAIAGLDPGRLDKAPLPAKTAEDEKKKARAGRLLSMACR